MKYYLAVADTTQRDARLATESDTAMSARQNVVTRMITGRSNARLMTGKLTTMVGAKPATWKRTDIARFTAGFAAWSVSTVELTAVFAWCTRLSTRCLHGHV